MKTLEERPWSLKVSLTNDCNLDCFYCNDRQRHGDAGKKRRFLPPELARNILKGARDSGIEGVQWTGGEPTLHDLSIFMGIANEVGFTRQAITTNGIKLPEMLDQLIELGLSRANISLDTLDSGKFAEITGSPDYEKVITSIRMCVDRLEMTKINVATMRSTIGEVPDFVHFVAGLGSPRVAVKFHELWPFKPRDLYDVEHVEPREITEAVASIGGLEPISVEGNNLTTKYYLVGDTGAKVGISPLPTDIKKCGGPKCRKIRVYANGVTCEGANFRGVENSEEAASKIGNITDRRRAEKSHTTV